MRRRAWNTLNTLRTTRSSGPDLALVISLLSKRQWSRSVKIPSGIASSLLPPFVAIDCTVFRTTSSIASQAQTSKFLWLRLTVGAQATGLAGSNRYLHGPACRQTDPVVHFWISAAIALRSSGAGSSGRDHGFLHHESFAPSVISHHFAARASAKRGNSASNASRALTPAVPGSGLSSWMSRAKTTVRAPCFAQPTNQP